MGFSYYTSSGRRLLKHGTCSKKRDVRLPLGDEMEADIINVVQPDISFLFARHP